MGVTDTSAAKKCAMCGKEFVVLYQDIWAYKRGEKWLCSWKCLRAYDKSKEGSSLRKVTLEDKKKAVQIAIDGGDPREYLGKLCKAPDAMWSSIRKALKDSDPEAFAKLPRSIKGTKKEAPKPHKEEEAEEMDEDFFPAGEDVKEPEPPKITQPIVYDGMVVRELEIPFGRIRRSDVAGKTYLDFEPVDGADTLSFTDDQWRAFFMQFNKAAKGLGVEL